IEIELYRPDAAGLIATADALQCAPHRCQFAERHRIEKRLGLLRPAQWRRGGDRLKQCCVFGKPHSSHSSHARAATRWRRKSALVTGWNRWVQRKRASIVGLIRTEQAELRRIAAGLGEAEMTEGVRREQAAARRALQIPALDQIGLDDVFDRIARL